MNTIRITRLKCGKCNYEWLPRTTKLPKVCPNCKSRNWQEASIGTRKRL